MSDNQSNNKRIAKNTLFLYGRMLFSLAVSLYTSRVILAALGVEDYGIYNVVGGVVSMFAFLSNTMATACQRFFNFEMGRGDQRKLKQTFQTANMLMITLGVITVILAEFIGLWFLYNKLTIPVDRFVAAQLVFHVAVISLFINIVSVPYNASIIAHEKMSAFAYIGIYDVLMRLLIAMCVNYILYDKLISYAILLFLVSLSIRLIYTAYCKRHFDECHNTKLTVEKSIAHGMLGFFGWNSIGAFSYVMKEQGVNIILNMFSGLVVNAARGVTTQVTGALYGFISNFQVAMNPQITKNYASGQYEDLINLVHRGSKFSYFLFLFLALPVFIDIDFILSLWLKVVPDHTANFIRLTILLLSIDTLSSPIITTLLATGDVKKYQIIVGGLLLLNLPLSYLALRCGLAPESTIVIAILLSFISLLARLVLARNMVNFSIREYCIKVLFRVIAVSLISFAISYWIFTKLTFNDFFKLILICICSWVVTLILIMYIGLYKKERELLLSYALKSFNRIKR